MTDTDAPAGSAARDAASAALDAPARSAAPDATPAALDAPAELSQERRDLLDLLGVHRHFLRTTLRDLDDEQATRRTTVSELTLATLIKHVAATETQWAAFVVEGPSAIGGWDAETIERHSDHFRINDGETVAGLLEAYRAVAERTDELVRTVDLDHAQPLPEAPWFPPGARWTARRVFIHIIAETSQHAGHADIIREALDGAKTMG